LKRTVATFFKKGTDSNYWNRKIGCKKDTVITNGGSKGNQTGKPVPRKNATRKRRGESNCQPEEVLVHSKRKDQTSKWSEKGQNFGGRINRSFSEKSAGKRGKWEGKRKLRETDRGRGGAKADIKSIKELENLKFGPKKIRGSAEKEKKASGKKKSLELIT